MQHSVSCSPTWPTCSKYIQQEIFTVRYGRTSSIYYKIWGYSNHSSIGHIVVLVHTIQYAKHGMHSWLTTCKAEFQTYNDIFYQSSDLKWHWRLTAWFRSNGVNHNIPTFTSISQMGGGKLPMNTQGDAWYFLQPVQIETKYFTVGSSLTLT